MRGKPRIVNLVYSYYRPRSDRSSKAEAGGGRITQVVHEALSSPLGQAVQPRQPTRVFQSDEIAMQYHPERSALARRAKLDASGGGQTRKWRLRRYRLVRRCSG